MGAVWLGRDEVLGRDVAMKRIGMMPDGERPDLERAEREARLAARLNHPHVVAIFDLLVEDDTQWLIMEYVEGVTLSQLVQRDGPLTPDEASPLVWQAADALAAAHAAGIVHRDVKPSNILVTPQGQVKLSDFGIARAEADASLTQTGLVTGSPAYLAPEVASGSTATDASDVWSLGATLFHALSGRPPYDVGENLLGALYRIVHEEPPRLADADWLAPLLERTMTREPADRWSMAQVRDFLHGSPTGTTVHPAPAAAGSGQASHTQVLPRAVPPAPRTIPPVSTPTPVEPTPAGRRRPGAATLLVGGAVALSVLLVVWAALAGGGGNDPADDVALPTTSSSPQPSEQPSSEDNDAPTEAGMERFIEDYLATASSDPETAFTLLTPEFQQASNGIDGYTGFWDTIDSAQLVSVSARPRALDVDYTVLYTRTDGSQSRDFVSLELEFENGDYLIAGEPG